MLSRRIYCFLLSALLSLPLIAAPEAGRYLRTHDVDATKMIPPAPADDSLTMLADLETVYLLQQRRSPSLLIA